MAKGYKQHGSLTCRSYSEIGGKEGSKSLGRCVDMKEIR